MSRQPVTPLRDLVVDRCVRSVFPAWRSDPVFLESLTHSVEENVGALREVLVGALAIGEVPLAHRMRFSSLEAEARVSQAEMQRSYRLSHFLQWQEWSKVVAAAGVRAGADTAESVLAQQSVAAVVHAYSDAVVSRVSRTFADSEAALNRSRAHIRQRLVRDLLACHGDGFSAEDLATLDYPPEAWHLAVLLPDVPAAQANQVAATLRSAVHQQYSLVYAPRLDTSVVWLGASRAWTDARIRQAVRALRTAGLTAVVSDTAAGTAGFARVFEQVQQVDAARPSAADGDASSVVRYADYRLEILLLRDELLAAEFVARELGPLADETSEAEKLRATVEASFRLGSHVAAAEKLGLHEHTVRNRLRRVEELVGPVQERQTEIQVALRLRKLLRKRQSE
ncbi:PucR family transcriptional regulator [Amycolatopsis acidicola]|uniref:PucR family transcriptional regulator n=1 Tax=Amycolatopsis acidicola TaxID=2596893 RepID=UPI00140B83F9|nr:helix-turn-helix domain-containing protein [Amycolatopsis acidicola]